MALQASGEIRLSQIQGEFGGSAPTAISEYYSAASGVPSSGQIKASDFYGKSYAPKALGVAQLGKTGTSNTATYSVTAPAGTKSAIVAINRNVNQYRDTQVALLTLGGTSMNEVLTAERTGSEYNTDSSIWVLNKTYNSSTSIDIKVIYVENSSASYGCSMQVVFLDRSFYSYTPTSSYHDNDTTGGLVYTYDDGVAVGVATRNTATEVTTFGTDYWYSSNEPDYYMTYEVPTSFGTGVLNLSGTLTGYGRSVTAMAAWARNKFI
jgi:hypothetical protein